MSERHGLGRKLPTDDKHLQRYALTVATLPTKPTPVVIGINWYEAFSNPQRDRRGVSWVPESNWGRILGGHAICLKPPGLIDNADWWRGYDQGESSACVGFSASRMMTLLNRRLYNGRFLYLAALKVDEFPGEADEGTTVRAGMDVLREQGAWRIRRGATNGPYATDGISANRWAQSVEEIAACLSPGTNGKAILDAGYVVWANSWGAAYPHLVRVPLSVLDRLLREDGEATVVTDR